MKILLVEDDNNQEDAIAQAIRKKFPDILVEPICTELEFRRWLDSLVGPPPDLIILDIMIRWTDPGPELTPQPPDVKEGKYFRAGIRCEKLLRSYPATKQVPAVFYSILEDKDLQDLPLDQALNCYLPKGSDTGPLLDKVRFWKDKLGF